MRMLPVPSEKQHARSAAMNHECPFSADFVEKVLVIGGGS
jgi:hypothetical protein